MAVCFIYFLNKNKVLYCRDDAYPGPQIGYLQEIIQWLDYYIKGIDNGYQNKEILSIYQLHPNVDELHPIIKKREGKWIHLNQIPDYPNEHAQRNKNLINQQQINNQKQIKYYLSFQSMTTEPISNNNLPNKISFLSPQETGTTSGWLLGHGYCQFPDNSIDQREDDGKSLSFNSLPLNDNYRIYQKIYLKRILLDFFLRIIWISKC